MAIASRDEKDVWVANVYFSADEKGNLYFVSSKDAKHSQMILKNHNVAFSIAWFDHTNSKNRKGVQGPEFIDVKEGSCVVVYKG